MIRQFVILDDELQVVNILEISFLESATRACCGREQCISSESDTGSDDDTNA